MSRTRNERSSGSRGEIDGVQVEVLPEVLYSQLVYAGLEGVGSEEGLAISGPYDRAWRLVLYRHPVVDAVL